MMVFRAGIVGCGRVGAEFDDDPKREQISTHAGAYSAVDSVELVAVCDLNEEKLRKCGEKWGIPSLYKDVEEMLDNEALDILSICTWNSSHLEIARQAASSGARAIFCEKPIADSLKNADEMIKLCHEKDIILQVDHQRRFDKFHQEVRSFLQGGNLGRIQQVTFYYTRGIANTGSHMFDLLRFFFGDAEWIRAIYSQNRSPNPNDPNIDGVMKFKDGLFCAIQACDDKNFLIFEMDCLGTEGRLNLTHSGYDLEFYHVGESKLFSGYKELFPAASPIDKDVPRDFMVDGVRHLIECLNKGQKSISSGEDGRAALELICAFHESAKEDGKRIRLPLRDSKIEIQSR
ncbi:MAG: Gfo/Idh/MocA family oxidoreductase [Dehalococcoidales bacterium]|nr:Gfo/Idh/MocA family oxidoreductase [Dehalococcoidales bacterium]